VLLLEKKKKKKKIHLFSKWVWGCLYWVKRKKTNVLCFFFFFFFQEARTKEQEPFNHLKEYFQE